MASYSATITAGPGDIDELGHVNNAVWVKWIQDVAVAHWHAVAAPEHAQAYIWVVTRHEIDYRAEAFAGEEIVAATWIESFGRTTCVRATRLMRLADDRLIAGAISRWVHIDLGSRRPRRIAEELRAAMPPRLPGTDRRDATARVD